MSLSGYSTPVAFLLVSLYLFAIFRGIARSQKIEIEHPVTTSFCYLVFYVVSPFLGSLTGAVVAAHITQIWNYWLVVAAGALATTFVVWIIIDPAAGMLEMLLPASRANRNHRLAQAEAVSRQQQIARQRVLADAEAAGKSEQARWEKNLRPYAEELVQLLTNCDDEEDSREKQVIDIGLAVWKMGGLNCMRRLYSMVADIRRKYRLLPAYEDYISVWWDGVGTWQGDWLNLQKNTV